ncbi:MAG: DUF2735 domain-containing protein [Afipia sp.]|jgi:hypothetical protein|nr:DUF2735 domain-containing protein [Afipia sp.]
MTTNVNGGSATIYQFPEGGRASMSGRTARVPAVNFGSQVVGEATYGSWYHDEAIRESQPKMSQAKAIQPKAVIVPLTFPRQ